MRRRRFSIAAPLLVLALAVSAEAQFENVIKRVPTSANALVLVNAEKVFDSSAAIKGGWKDRLIEAHKSGLTILRPSRPSSIST